VGLMPQILSGVTVCMCIPSSQRSRHADNFPGRQRSDAALQRNTPLAHTAMRCCEYNPGGTTAGPDGTCICM
jgi:hypothetical protein